MPSFQLVTFNHTGDVSTVEETLLETALVFWAVCELAETTCRVLDLFVVLRQRVFSVLKTFLCGRGPKGTAFSHIS